MICNEAQLELSAYLDDAVPAQERAALEAHIKECAACQALLAELTSVKSSLAALPKVKAPSTLAEKIRRGMAEPAASAPASNVISFPTAPKRSMWAPAIMGVAAMLVAGVIIFVLLPLVSEQNPKSSVGMAPAARDAHAPTGADAPPAQPSHDELRAREAQKAPAQAPAAETPAKFREESDAVNALSDGDQKKAKKELAEERDGAGAGSSSNLPVLSVDKLDNPEAQREIRKKPEPRPFGEAAAAKAGQANQPDQPDQIEEQAKKLEAPAGAFKRAEAKPPGAAHGAERTIDPKGSQTRGNMLDAAKQPNAAGALQGSAAQGQAGGGRGPTSDAQPARKDVKTAATEAKQQQAAEAGPAGPAQDRIAGESNRSTAPSTPAKPASVPPPAPTASSNAAPAAPPAAAAMPQEAPAAKEEAEALEKATLKQANERLQDQGPAPESKNANEKQIDKTRQLAKGAAAEDLRLGANKDSKDNDKALPAEAADEKPAPSSNAGLRRSLEAASKDNSPLAVSVQRVDDNMVICKTRNPDRLIAELRKLSDNAHARFGLGDVSVTKNQRAKVPAGDSAKAGKADDAEKAQKDGQSAAEPLIYKITVSDAQRLALIERIQNFAPANVNAAKIQKDAARDDQVASNGLPPSNKANEGKAEKEKAKPETEAAKPADDKSAEETVIFVQIVTIP
jgi:hypothetical protein